MKRVAAKFVLHFLSEDQRANRLDVCREMKDQLKTDPDFLSKIITGDESWCYRFSECRGGDGENDCGTEGYHFARVPELF
jgi:hypothetical protein